MEIGFSLPQIGPQATPENLIRAAQRAEELGYDSLWVLERLLWPISPKAPYLPSPDGSLPLQYQNVLDPVETLTFVSAITKKIKLGTSVIVLPCHNPVILARRLATLDVLSNGRLILGVGLGWSPDEFEAAGVNFERRGERGNEFLKLLKKIWTEDDVEFRGDFYRVAKSKIGPKPLQKPHPPIYIGGFTKKAFERAIRYANGFHPAGIKSFDDLESIIKSIKDMANKARRNPDEMGILIREVPTILDKSDTHKRKPFIGTVDEIGEDIRRYSEIGVTHLLFDLNFSLPDRDIFPMIIAMEKLIQAAKM